MRTRAFTRKNSPETRQGESIEKVGSLLVAQPRRGYRYGLDPFLLVAFIQPRLREKVVDIGTGCGILLLLAASRWPSLRLWGIELQPDLADLARSNVERNDLSRRCGVIQGDARRIGALLPEGGFHRVIANPPFRPPRSGRKSLQPQRAIARQELTFALADLVGAASYLLDHGGALDFIHLPERLPEIFRITAGRKLEPKRLRFVQSFCHGRPEMVLISARKNGRPGLKVMPPLVVFSKPGTYTDEVSEIFRETGLSPERLSS